MQTNSRGRRRRSWLRRLWRIAFPTASLFALATVGIAWYYAGQIYAGAFKVDRSIIYDLRVVAVTGTTITLQPASKAAANGVVSQQGTFGIDWPGGYARAGLILSSDANGVTRELTPMRGAPQPGDRVRLDNFAYPHDPGALGLSYEEVSVPGPDGSLPAWRIDGSSDTWLVSVHGKGSSAGEVLRLLAGLTPGVYPVMAISYRNDADTPPSADGRYGYGASEWRDLAAAVSYAQAAGAHRIVLVGYSMGGAIVLSYLEHAQATDDVAGLILDAPALDFDGIVDYAGQRRQLPGLVTALAKAMAARRYGIDFSALDYRATAQALSVPLLLFHGTADKTVPIAASKALAKADPAGVHLEIFEGAGHVRAWNVDAARYDSAVRDFLLKLQ